MPSPKIKKICEGCKKSKLSFKESRFCSRKCIVRDSIWTKRISRSLKFKNKKGELKSTFQKGHRINNGRRAWNKDKKGIYSKEVLEKIRQARLKQIIPNKDTLIETKLQDILKENHILFKTHYPILGQPDIFIEPNICIFADGCYWHKCSTCGFGHGKEKDTEVNKELTKQGYIVVRLWEHEINDQATITKRLLYDLQ